MQKQYIKSKLQREYIESKKTLLISEENSDKLKKVSKKLNISMASLLNIILEDFFNQKDIEIYIESKKNNQNT